jgi:SAM-dependent methyltransferase
MCYVALLQTIEGLLQEHDIAARVRGKHVIEVGSYDVNGTARTVLEPLEPAHYVGVDIIPGPNVDSVCSAFELETRFGRDSFDVVVCTEVLEHIDQWRRAIRNINAILKPGGLLIFSSPSQGFPYHSFPHDYWRFEQEDLPAIFANYTIDRIVSFDKPRAVLMLATRNAHTPEPDLDAIALYSMLTGSRIRDITWSARALWSSEWFVRRAMGRMFPARKDRYTMVY